MGAGARFADGHPRGPRPGPGETPGTVCPGLGRASPGRLHRRRAWDWQERARGSLSACADVVERCRADRIRPVRGTVRPPGALHGGAGGARAVGPGTARRPGPLRTDLGWPGLVGSDPVAPETERPRVDPAEACGRHASSDAPGVRRSGGDDLEPETARDGPGRSPLERSGYGRSVLRAGPASRGRAPAAD